MSAKPTPTIAPKPEPKRVAAETLRENQTLAYEGVSVEIVEVNPLKHPFSPTTYTIAYRIVDARLNPPFKSAIAHYFAATGENVAPAFAKILKHYDDIKHTLRG